MKKILMIGLVGLLMCSCHYYEQPSVPHSYEVNKGCCGGDRLYPDYTIVMKAAPYMSGVMVYKFVYYVYRRQVCGDWEGEYITEWVNKQCYNSYEIGNIFYEHGCWSFVQKSFEEGN